MKSLYLTESEKQQILNLHKSRMLSEQAPATPAPAPAKVTNYTIQQLQTLLNSKGYNVGAADNQLGKGTLAQIEAAVKVAKGGTPAAPAATTSLPAPTIAPMDVKKPTGLQTDASGKVTSVTTATVPGTPATPVAAPPKEQPLY
jgi:hypothetical protein